MNRQLAISAGAMIGTGVFLLLAAACGDSSTGTGTTAATGGSGGGSADGGPAGPGELTIAVEGVTDATGKILVIFVYPPGGNVGTAMAGACMPVMASPFSGTDKIKARTAGSTTPCELETTAKVFDAGSQNVFAGVFSPGAMMPEKCAQTTVQIRGDTTLTLPALGSCGP
jgi:hypothetical protein